MKCYIISSVREVKSNLTIPANVCLKFEDGGMCEVQEGAELVINGPVEAPAVQIFRGSGKVFFGANSAEKVLPQWWGAVTDDGADDTAAIQAAIDSLYSKIPPGPLGITSLSGGVVFLPGGKYEISARLVFYNGITLEGTPFRTTLYATQPLPAMLQRPDLTPPPDGIHFNAATRIDGIRIANLVLDGGRLDSAIGLDLTNTNYSVIENVNVSHCKTGIMMAQLGMYTTFINVSVGVCDVGIETNIGVMGMNVFGGVIGGVRIGMLIKNTAHLNIYGTLFDSFKETGIDIRSSNTINMHHLWFDSVAPATAIKVSASASVNAKLECPLLCQAKMSC